MLSQNSALRASFLQVIFVLEAWPHNGQRSSCGPRTQQAGRQAGRQAGAPVGCQAAEAALHLGAAQLLGKVWDVLLHLVQESVEVCREAGRQGGAEPAKGRGGEVRG